MVVGRLPLLSLVLAGALVLEAAPAQAGIDGDEFESSEWRVRLQVPRMWRPNERTSYPNVLLWMTRRTPAGRMLLSAERLRRPEDAAGYAARTVARLRAMGFRVRAPQLHSATGAQWIDAENATSYVRQAYLVAGRVGYTLTLAADSSRARSQHLRAFDAALRSMRVVSGQTPSGDHPAPPLDAVDPG